MTYVKDYQGNVRQVTDADGNVEQDNHYYPYGMLMAESSDILATARGGNVINPNPYLYGSKEYLTTAGANLLDFTARTYDPSLPLFQTQDPQAGDYTQFLPYLYCGADPINRIDPTGKDIAVLLVEGTPGHMGLLVSTDDGKWLYYSVNGNNLTVSGNFSGGKHFNEVGVDGEWSSPQDFLDSEFNTEPAEGGEDNPNYANYNYTEAYQIKTTPEQDKIIAETFADIANEEYGLFSNNCAHAVQRSLQEAGVLPYETTVTRYFNPGNLGYTISFKTNDNTFLKPSAAFSVIKSNIPSGKSYFKSK